MCFEVRHVVVNIIDICVRTEPTSRYPPPSDIGWVGMLYIQTDWHLDPLVQTDSQSVTQTCIQVTLRQDSLWFLVTLPIGFNKYRPLSFYLFLSFTRSILGVAFFHSHVWSPDILSILITVYICTTDSVICSLEWNKGIQVNPFFLSLLPLKHGRGLWCPKSNTVEACYVPTPTQ